MGDLIMLADRRADRLRPGHEREAYGPAAAGGRAVERPAFFFDLACPFSYLVAERVERTLGEVDWVPVARTSLPNRPLSLRSPKLRQLAERRAMELRLPLVWPERGSTGTPSALRAAAYAADVGAGATFALAASRLAFCGGFDLEDPEILAEAAAAAGIPLEGCLAAASDTSWDDELRVVGYGLASRGINELPAIRVDRRLLGGERCLAEAAALLSSTGAERRPLAPVG
jgi:2-hydroxychromene-2-carboxylate isomerase